MTFYVEITWQFGVIKQRHDAEKPDFGAAVATTIKQFRELHPDVSLFDTEIKITKD